MIIVRKVYLEERHIDILKKEPEIVRKRYHAVVRTLVSDVIRITRQEAAVMIITLILTNVSSKLNLT